MDFFTEKHETCKGCRGCNSDDFKFPELKTVNTELADNDKPLPLVMPKISISPGKDVLKKSAFVTKNIFSTFNQTLTPSKSGQNIFNITSFAAPEIKSNSNTSIFGNTNTQNMSAVGALNSDANQSTNVSTTTTAFGFGQHLFGGSIFNTNSTEIAKPAPILCENSITPVFGASNTTDTNVKTTTSSFVFGNINSSKPIDASKASSESKLLFGGFESKSTTDFSIDNKTTNLSNASTNIINDKPTNDGTFSPFGSGTPLFGTQSSGSIFGTTGKLRFSCVLNWNFVNI